MVSCAALPKPYAMVLCVGETPPAMEEKGNLRKNGACNTCSLGTDVAVVGSNHDVGAKVFGNFCFKEPQGLEPFEQQGSGSHGVHLVFANFLVPQGPPSPPPTTPPSIHAFPCTPRRAVDLIKPKVRQGSWMRGRNPEIYWGQIYCKTIPKPYPVHPNLVYVPAHRNLAPSRYIRQFTGRRF